MNLRKFQSLDLTGKKVFVRLDLNVPIKSGKIQDATRIIEALPTLKHILTQTDRIAIVSHLGRPKGQPTPEFSLEPVGEALAELLGKEVILMHEFWEDQPSRFLDTLRPGQILLLENIRFQPGEEKNDSDFAQTLIEGFDYYVNDAFGTVHRAHASVVACAEKLAPEKRGAGLLIQKEVEALKTLMTNPGAPFTVVMGGAKVSDKMSVILSLLNRCNNLLIGGAMAYSFLKFKGVGVGTSKVEADKMELIETIFRNAEARRVNIVLPSDHVCAEKFSADAAATKASSAEVPAGLMGLDIGPKTVAAFSQIILNSKTVFWNGPMGVFEWPAFSLGSLGVAQAMASAVGVRTVVGGGDSVSAVNLAGVADKMSHISTGGGASLEYLEGQALPGLKVLEER